MEKNRQAALPAEERKKTDGTAPAEERKKTTSAARRKQNVRTERGIEEVAAGAILAKEPAEEPAEEPAKEPAKGSVKEPAKEPAKEPEEKGKANEDEEKAPAFLADGKEKCPKEYAARVQIAARYTDEQARNMLRKKIAQCKEVHLRFLQKIAEENAFKTEKLFVPVHCGKADVRYFWKTKANGVETEHEEICTKERRFSGAKEDLDVTNFQLDKSWQAGEKKTTELVENGGYDFKKTFRNFNACLKSMVPAKGAHIEKRDESYTLVYVPVMKTICTLDGEQYVGYVNLYNGACYSSYKVSDALEKAASKATLSAGYARRSLCGTFVFSLTFCLLTLLSALKLCDWSFGDLKAKTVVLTLLLAGLSLPSLALMLGVNAVKKEALIEKALRMNKLPGTSWARFASAVGVLCALASVLVFFFQVMI